MSKLYNVKLTAEQMKQLGLKIDPFERADEGEDYYYAGSQGIAYHDKDLDYSRDNERYNAGNYCTDEDIMRQRVLHETLSRLLWRFSMQHYGDEIDWGSAVFNYCIYYDHRTDDWGVSEWFNTQHVGVAYFASKEVAERAIKEIVRPFIAKHSNFEFGGCCL